MIVVLPSHSAEQANKLIIYHLQYRNSRTGARSTRAQIDHDVLDGLPVRHWRKKSINVNVAPEKDNLDALNTADTGWPELPMPRDSHLLSSVSETLLRAARMAQIKQPAAPLMEDEKEPGEHDDLDGELDMGFVAKRWAIVPKELEGPEPEFLAKRRKGLPSVNSRTAIGLGSTGHMRKTKIRKTDTEGNNYVWEVLVPEGQAVDDEIVEEETSPTQAPALGTVVEGLGVVNAEGVVIAGDQAMPPANRRRPPPPKRKAKGTGRGRKKKVAFTSSVDGAPTANGPRVVINGATNGIDEANTTNGTQRLHAMLQDGEEGSEEMSEGEEGEEGDREDGELSPSLSSARSTPKPTPPMLLGNKTVPPTISHDASQSPPTAAAPAPMSILQQPIPEPMLLDEDDQRSSRDTANESVIAPLASSTEPTGDMKTQLFQESVTKPIFETQIQANTESAAEPTVYTALQGLTECGAEPLTEKCMQSISEGAARPLAEPTIQPVIENPAEIIDETTMQSAAESITVPIAENRMEPAIESTSEPANEAIKDPLPQHIAEPTTQAVAEATSQTAVHHIVETLPEVPTKATPEPVLETAPASVGYYLAKSPTQAVGVPAPDTSVESITEIIMPEVPMGFGTAPVTYVREPATDALTEPTEHSVPENTFDDVSTPSVVLTQEPTPEATTALMTEPMLDSDIELPAESMIAPIVEAVAEPGIMPEHMTESLPDSMSRSANETLPEAIPEHRFSFTGNTASPKAPTPSPPTPIESTFGLKGPYISPRAPTMSPPTPIDRGISSSPDLPLATQQFRLPPQIDAAQKADQVPAPATQHLGRADQILVEAAPQVEPHVSAQIPVEHNPLDGMAEPRVAKGQVGREDSDVQFSDGEEDLLGSLERSLGSGADKT